MAKLQLDGRTVDVPDETVVGLTEALGSREMAAAALRASMDPEYGKRMMAAVNDPSMPDWTRDMAKMVVGMRGIGRQQAPPQAAPPVPPQAPPMQQAPPQAPMSPFMGTGPMPPNPQPRLSLNDIMGPLMGMAR